MTKENIKQICQIYDNFRSERDAATIIYNSDNAFWDHVLATYNLSQPSLPSNLDEAAEESMPEEEGFLELDIYGGSEAVYSREQMLAMFKAGAEWLREQGETYTTHVEDASNNEERFPAIFVPVDSFKPGDKVVVQIRKKY